MRQNLVHIPWQVVAKLRTLSLVSFGAQYRVSPLNCNKRVIYKLKKVVVTYILASIIINLIQLQNKVSFYGKTSVFVEGWNLVYCSILVRDNWGNVLYTFCHSNCRQKVQETFDSLILYVLGASWCYFSILKCLTATCCLRIIERCKCNAISLLWYEIL